MRRLRSIFWRRCFARATNVARAVAPRGSSTRATSVARANASRGFHEGPSDELKKFMSIERLDFVKTKSIIYFFLE